MNLDTLEEYLGSVVHNEMHTKAVTIRRTTKCYHELPILVSNQSRFMAPLTKIIQNHAEVDCNHLIPLLYFLDDQWVGLAPNPTVSTPPKQLAIEAKPNF